ncbi:MAG: ammonium transporter, partial [Novosphingobium sp.]|nr:ammonium transporter [Novosphingobium sp.]
PSLGGVGYADGMTMGNQFLGQVVGIGVVAIWSIIASVIIALMVSVLFPMRVDDQTERDGLDIASHGERAWEMD